MHKLKDTMKTSITVSSVYFSSLPISYRLSNMMQHHKSYNLGNLYRIEFKDTPLDSTPRGKKPDQKMRGIDRMQEHHHSVTVVSGLKETAQMAN